jgi:hypothetical protein
MRSMSRSCPCVASCRVVCTSAPSSLFEPTRRRRCSTYSVVTATLCASMLDLRSRPRCSSCADGRAWRAIALAARCVQRGHSRPSGTSSTKLGCMTSRLPSAPSGCSTRRCRGRACFTSTRCSGWSSASAKDAVENACCTTLDVDLLNLKRLTRLVELAVKSKPPPTLPTHVIPTSRFLRPAERYALPGLSVNNPCHDQQNDE